jgi:xanthine dehydrogenase YagS FAD-binding subunit
MRKFIHFNATSIEYAALILSRYEGRAKLIAGGTDLLGTLKDEILPTYPEALVNLKSIPGLDYIIDDEEFIRIGGLTRLSDIANDPLLIVDYPALSEAARRTATPQIREMGTIAGNICQDIRCWYYRNPNNRFPCLRKGGGRCYALDGDNRYHSIFGGSVEGGCIAVHPSDIAPALIVLDAWIVTNKRKINLRDFFTVDVCKTTVLRQDEVIVEICIPKSRSRSAFKKFAIRKSIGFPVVNCAVAVNFMDNIVQDARICLNAVDVVPRRALSAEKYLVGKALNKDSSRIAGEEAVSNAVALELNRYKIQVAKILVMRALLSCCQRKTVE